MKTLLFLFLSITSLRAQWVVHDPGNTAVNTAIQAEQASQHLETMGQWAEQLERLNRQLIRLEEQLAVQRRIREVIGNPTAAGVGLVLRDLGADDLAHRYGETLAATRRLANAIGSLRRTSDGIYHQLDDLTSLGETFTRFETRYRRFATVEQQADHFASVLTQTDERAAALQASIADSVTQLRSAETQAEVDKLSATLSVLHGQLDEVATRRRDEADKLLAQHILNENQAAKEQQDFLEKQIAEERNSLGVIGAWQESVQVKPTSYTQP